MKILVEHEVPCEKGMEGECLYPGDFWERMFASTTPTEIEPTERKLRWSGGFRNAPYLMNGSLGSIRNAKNVWKRQDVDTPTRRF